MNKDTRRSVTILKDRIYRTRVDIKNIMETMRQELGDLPEAARGGDEGADLSRILARMENANDGLADAHKELELALK